MNIIRLRVIIISILLLTAPCQVFSQVLKNLEIVKNSGISVENIIISDSIPVSFEKKPLFSFLLNNKKYSSDSVIASVNEKSYTQHYDKNVSVKFSFADSTISGVYGEIIFENKGSDTVIISNVLPFAENANSVYITANGPSDLARAWLHRPRFSPLRVILPDNAWESGYLSFNAANDISVCALARRLSCVGGKLKRYETVLPPDAKVVYSLHIEIFNGEWQNGLRLMFHDKYLYDVSDFDNTLYERLDLKWIKESYLIVLQMAWDREYYDRFTNKFTYPDVIKKGNELFGNIDIFGIWPTWPRLGLDQRNQWDLYHDLPGGTAQLRSFIKMSHQSNTRVFVSYNPWDNDSKTNHLQDIGKLISETEADGMILDTRGNSGIDLQRAADSVRKGFIMYSEGMAVPKDMQGIISGRVHNAIFLSPELNLNKLIKPDFSIFRVCDVGEAPVHREVAVAFFNGYGTELNLFRAGGRDEIYRKDMEFLSRTTFILRQNNDAFLDQGWIPLIETTLDKVYINKWKSGEKMLFTILNMRPEGVSGRLFKVEAGTASHYVSLWNHENITPVHENNEDFIHASIPGWYSEQAGTRSEGTVECIAGFPHLIQSSVKGDSLKVNNSGNGYVLIWKGNPSYQASFKKFKILTDTTICIKDLFGYYEGKIVIQLLENNRLKDETILELKGGRPWLISKVVPTSRATEVRPDMVLVPGTRFSFDVTTGEEFISYPEISTPVDIDSFLIDKFPVTNAQYYEFMVSSGYWPSDTTRFLRHWQSGTFRQGQDKYPVVYVSYEDMMAYAKWAGKRLPTQAEWQLAAQGLDKRIWPWGNEFHGTFCNNSFNRPTPVDAFSKGLSPYGVIDMVGNVWQMTNDTYFNGSNYFTIIRGGSYFKPESSSWYLQGGPQPLDHTQILLLVSPGFDRSPTVGFRCVKDINPRKFR